MRTLAALLLLGVTFAFTAVFAQDKPKAALIPPAPKKEEAKKDEPYDPVKADLELIKSAGYGTEPPDLIEFFRKHTISETDKAKINAIIGRLGDDDFDVREAATDELSKSGVVAIALLRTAQKHRDPEIVRRAEICLKAIEKVPTRAIAAAAARLLAKNPTDGTTDALLSYLPLADDESVAEEIRNTFAALCLRNGKPDPILEGVLEHPDALKRSAAAEAFARSADKATRERMKAFLKKEKDEVIRQTVAIALIVAGKEKELVPDLIRILGEVPQSQGWKAEELLCRIAGEDVPAISLGTDQAGREKARDEWLKWWETNQAKVDLAKLDTESSYGLTVFCEISVRGGLGRVVAQDAGGKVKWEVKGINYPADALVLPGQRVLIAEMNRQRIVEREIGGVGKEIWTENFPQPVKLGRLSNGTTWAVGRSGIAEWERGEKAPRKKLFEYQYNDGDIVAGDRTKAGEYWVLTQGSNSIMKIDRKGTVVKQHNIGGRGVGYNATLEILPDDKALVTMNNSVCEVDLASGKIGWTHTANNATSAQRLRNGNTLVTIQNTSKVYEVDRDNKQVRDYKPTDNVMRPARVFKR
jgi:hypothetical protein